MPKSTTREEHLAWCKQRALEYCEAGDLRQAFASMTSDMRKHPDTSSHPAIELGFQMMLMGQLDSQEQMRKFILGFN